MKNALILHGNSGTSAGNWIPWLKSELEKIDYQVWAPDLPNADNPNLQRYNNFIFKNKDFTFNEETIIVGHSSGAVAILGLLQALPANIRVSSVYLVGSFDGDLHIAGIHHEELFLIPFNFDLIKRKAKKFVFFHSDDDPYCPLHQAKNLAEKTNGELIILPGQKHFNISTAGEKYKKFPELLEKIKENEN